MHMLQTNSLIFTSLSSMVRTHNYCINENTRKLGTRKLVFFVFNYDLCSIKYMR